MMGYSSGIIFSYTDSKLFFVVENGKLKEKQ